jgi:hypothetical protein
MLEGKRIFLKILLRGVESKDQGLLAHGEGKCLREHSSANQPDRRDPHVEIGLQEVTYLDGVNGEHTVLIFLVSLSLLSSGVTLLHFCGRKVVRETVLYVILNSHETEGFLVESLAAATIRWLGNCLSQGLPNCGVTH